MLVVVGLEIGSWPFFSFLLGSFLGAPNVKVGFWIKTLMLISPGILISVVAFLSLWLERNRRFYPLALLLLVAFVAVFLVIQRPSLLHIVLDYAQFRAQLFLRLFN
ncbi:MAG: hypothetical protein E6Q28_10190 [Afipia sp.]|nr:MAG: hypothetical protein E6Q28_10190 [Afipia sp.]